MFALTDRDMHLNKVQAVNHEAYHTAHDPPLPALPVQLYAHMLRGSTGPSRTIISYCPSCSAELGLAHRTDPDGLEFLQGEHGLGL